LEPGPGRLCVSVGSGPRKIGELPEEMELLMGTSTVHELKRWEKLRKHMGNSPLSAGFGGNI
jgi:hypothetical protein